MDVLLLNKTQVARLLTWEDVIPAVEDAFRAYCAGRVLQPDIMSIQIPERNGEIDFKACYARDTGLISMKGASGFWRNEAERGLPNSLGLLCLFDGETGAPVCLMDGSLITGMRTGAAGAVSAKLLAREDSRTLGIIGAGNQGRMQAAAITRVREIEQILIWDRSPEAACRYAEEVSAQLAIPVTACVRAEEAVRPADIVVTATPGTAAIVEADWVQPGTHIAAIGADMAGKRELEPQLFRNAKVVCDSTAQCVARGETQNALRERVITPGDIHCQLGEILLGDKAERENEREITIFDATGLAAQDNFTAAKIYAAAREQGVGTRFDMMPA